MVHVVNTAALAGLALAGLVAWPRTRWVVLWVLAGLVVLAVFVVRRLYTRLRGRPAPSLELPRRPQRASIESGRYRHKLAHRRRPRHQLNR